MNDRITLDEAAAAIDLAVRMADHRADLAVDLADSAYLRAYRMASVRGGRMPVAQGFTWAARHWPLFMPLSRPWPRTVAEAEAALVARELDDFVAAECA